MRAANQSPKANENPENILIGPAGWSYPDWKGVVYPAKRGGAFDPLTYIAKHFRVVEIDSTFYRIPEPVKTAEWAGRVDGSPGFSFTVKLFQGFTHTRKASIVDERAFHRALEPLRKHGRLGAVLVQWPWSFRNSAENRQLLCDLVTRFSAYPIAVEFRHGSWASKDVLSLLREKGAAFCNIDQPLLASCLGPTSAVTADLAYFRFHGRNSGQWFAEGAGRDERYNYLYGEEELAPWLGALLESAQIARQVVVIFNNHYRGKAVANAFQLQHAITGEKVSVPPQLLQEYPHLQSVSDTIFQPSLFPP